MKNRTITSINFLTLMMFLFFSQNVTAEIHFSFGTSMCMFGCNNGTTPCGQQIITNGQGLCSVNTQSLDTCGAMAAQACGMNNFVSFFDPNGFQGTVSSWDFHGGFVDHYGDDTSSYGGEFVNGFCKFECTGTGYHCPTEPQNFDQLSTGVEPLKCENLNYTANEGACNTLAVQTCSHTVVMDSADPISDSGKTGGPRPQFISSPTRPDINGQMWWVSDFSGGLNSSNPSNNDPTANIFVIQSFTDSKGKSLDATQTLLQMGVSQLVEKNAVAPVKK